MPPANGIDHIEARLRSSSARALVEFWQAVYENLAEFDVPLPVRPFR